MKEKKNIKLENNKNTISNPETQSIIKKKITFFQDIIEKTIIHVQKNKTFDILGVNDVNNCLDNLHDINIKLKEIPFDTNENIQTSTHQDYYSSKLNSPDLQ